MNNRAVIGKFLLMSRIEKNLSDRTIKAYGCDLYAFAASLQGRSILEVKLHQLREYLAYLQSRTLKPATIKRKLATLKVFYAFLEDERMVDSSPAVRLKKRYRVPKRLPRVMSLTEIKALLQAADDATGVTRELGGFQRLKSLRDRAILEILFSTGIRTDELVKLNTHDLDLEQGTVIISGKGRKERLLYISCTEVIDAIREYLQARSGFVENETGLFVGRFGNRLTGHSIRLIFDTYLKRAGITRKFTPHCLRHSMATMLIENGADVRSVQMILGHSQISTTAIYLEVSRRRKQEVMSKYNQRNQWTIRT